MSLVTVNKPREVVPLKASISAVNWPGMLAWINAPAPTMGTLKVSVTGPLPPLPESEVQIRLSPAVKPLPPVQLQLAGIGEHTTETMLLAPARVTVSLLPPAEFALKLAGRIVWSPPSCTQLIESLAPCPGWLVTWTSESAQAVPVASMIRQPLIMLLNPSVPAKTIPEFIHYAKANPGKINMASASQSPFRLQRTRRRGGVPLRGGPPVVLSCRRRRDSMPSADGGLSVLK